MSAGDRAARRHRHSSLHPYFTVGDQIMGGAPPTESIVAEAV
jgi:hypothetical protein